jgi:glycosyltransferase involved in cell wall biosynthesis
MRALLPEPLSISVVIPAYNEEAYLGKCLEALGRNAQGRACEIIVVDNASTDRTRAVALSHPGVICLYEPAKGITRARQCGYRAAQGEILAFVDADTMPPPGWIEQIEEQFAKDRRLACLSGPYRYYDLPPLRRWLASAYFVAASPVARALGFLVLGGNFAIRRSVLDAMGGFDQSIQFYGEDADIGARARKFGRVRFRSKFRMPTSARRLEGEGYVKTTWTYVVNFAAVAIRGRPVTKSYRDIR